MTLSHVFGLILLLLGVFLVGFGLRASQTITDKVVGGLTGHYRERTLWFLIGGALLALAGGALLFFGEVNTPVIHP